MKTSEERSEHQFAPGEEVICVDTAELDDDVLVKGRTYTIERSFSMGRHKLVLIKELPGRRFLSDRFVNMRKNCDAPPSKSYTFKTSSPLALDCKLIKKDLSRENPLAIIYRSDGYHRAVVHESMMRKLYAMDEADGNNICWDTNLDKFFDWRKTEKGNISEIIKLVKEIKNASWPNKKDTTFKVEIIEL